MSQDTYKRRRRSSGTTVSATEAAKNFGEIVDRVREEGVAYVVERKGRPIVEISPVSRRCCSMARLARWFADRRPPPAAYTEAVGDYVRKANRPRVPERSWAR